METSDIQGLITEEANAQGIPPEIALAVADKESSFNQSAIGTSGERGVFQIMPGTAKDLSVDPTNLEQNIKGGITYLKQLNDQTQGDWNDTLTAYNGGIGNLERGTVSDAAKEYPKDVFARSEKYKSAPQEDTYSKPPPLNLDVPPTAQGFSQVLFDRLSDPTFEGLSFEDQTKAVSDIYHAKEWDRKSYPIYKEVMNNIWDAASPDALPDIKEIIGPPPITQKDPVKETAAWKIKVVQDLLAQGVSPGAFGNRLDQYLDKASQDEIDAFGVRNEGFVSGSIAAVGNDIREAAKGAAGAITTPLAGITRLSGAYETADTIQNLPELLGKPRNSYLYETDEKGYLKLDDNNQPIPRYRGQIAQMVGGVGAFLAGGEALAAVGVGSKAIGAGLFTVNALSAGNDIFKDVYDRTGSAKQAYTGALFALPASAFASLGEAAVISKWANPEILGLSAYNRAKVFARNYTVGLAGMGAYNATEQAGRISQTGEDFNKEELAVSAIGGGLASGIVAAVRARPNVEPTKLNDIPAPNEKATASPEPVVRATDEERIDIAKKLETFQKSPAQELVVPVADAEKIHPSLLDTFALDVAPEGENFILRKKSTYTPIEPNEDLAVLDKQIGTLNRDLIRSGTPDDMFGFTEKLSNLKKQYSDLETSIGPTTVSVIKGRNILEAEVNARRGALDEETDPILRQVAYAELQDARSNLDAFDAANESVFELPSKLGELDSQIQETQAQLQKGLGATFPNDISFKQANLEGLLRKKKAVVSEIKKTQEEARAKAQEKPVAEGAKPKAPEVQTTKEIIKEAIPEFDHTEVSIPVGSKHVTPVNGKWVVFNKEGTVTGKPEDYFADAVDIAQGKSVGAKQAIGLKPETIGERLRVSKILDPRITAALGGEEGAALLYKPQSNKESEVLASEFIQSHGSLAEAAQAFINLPDTHTTPESVFAGENLIEAFDEVSKSAAKRGDNKVADSAAQLSYNIAEKSSAMLKLAGQTVQAAKVFARLSPESYIRKVEATLRENDLPGLSDADKARITELMEAAKKSGGTIQQNLLNEVGRIEMAATKGAFSSGSSPFFQVWQANQLSDPSTQAVNAVGNAAQLFGSAASFLSTGLPRGNFDGLEMLKGFYKGALDEGFHAAMLELQGIHTYKPQASKADLGSRGPAITRSDFVRDAPKWMQKIGLNNLGYVFRALSATDAFFYKAAQEGMGRLAAHGIATEEGLTGTARKNRIAELLYDSTKAWEAAAVQARAEIAAAKGAGIKPSKSLERIRTWEILEEKRPESIRTESLNFASKNTFNNKPEGVLGNLVTTINKFAGTTIKLPGGREVRPFKYLFPFMNVAGNIANASLDYTPVGGYRAAFDGNLSNLERRNTLGKFMLGSLLTGTLYGLSKEFQDDKDPYFALYGSGPRDAQQKKIWQDSGARPYSMKIGDNYYRYSETPLGIALGATAAILDAERYDKSFNRADLPEAIGIGLSGSLKAFTDNSFLKSIGTVVKAVTGDADAKVLDALFTNPVKGFVPAAGAQRAISKLIQDPIETKNDFYSKLVSGIPFAQAYGTKPALNMFGQPVERTWEDRLSFIGRFYSDRVTDEAPRYLAESGYTLPDFGVTVGGSKTLKNKRAEDLGAGFADVLTPDERYELIEKAGPLIEQRVLQYKARYGNYYSPEIQEKLNEDVKAIRSRVKKQIILGASED